MILFFDPFFERTSDSYFYGVSGMRIVDEQYTFSHELLQNIKSQEFVPFQWKYTVQSDAVPINLGLPLISAGIYSIFGLYGIFYFGPISTIALLITSERITTKLFGRMVGLVALLFLATSELVLYVGRLLLTDNFFTIFFILGIFYLIMFYKNKKEKYILIASIFFAFSTFIRISGMISLPIELVVIGLVLFNKNNLRSSFSIWHKASSRVQYIKNHLRFTGKVTLPWLVIIILIFSYNSYFFGDPLGWGAGEHNRINFDRGFVDSLSKTPFTDRLNNLLSYSNSILPSPINRIQGFSENYDQRLDEYYPAISKFLKPVLLDVFESKFNFGIISFIILGIGILISLITKQKSFEIIVYGLFICSFLFVFSKSFVVDRYMLPLLPLFFAIIGYLILTPFKIKNSKETFKRLLLVSKISVLVFVFIFFVFAFYLSEPIQIFKIEGFEMTDPFEKAKRYPLDNDGLDKNSIIIGALSSKTLDYGLIPFNPMYNHPKKINFDQNYITVDSINLINQTMRNGYNFYVLKEPQSHLDKPFFTYLTENHHFVLKDYSSNFCKVEIDKDNNGKSDEDCL